MKVIKTNLSGLKTIFPKLNDEKEWYPVLQNKKADYYVYYEDDEPFCFAGIVFLNANTIEVKDLWADKERKNATAVFELMNYIGGLFMDKHIKIYVINDIALWGWLRIGFKIKRTRQFKHWTAYWVEREAIYEPTRNRSRDIKSAKST